MEIENNNVNVLDNKDNNDIEDNNSGMCGSEMISDICTLKCGHKYHFECIYLSYKFSNNKICPYCRKPGGKLCIKNSIDNKKCISILKSGKRKGEECGCKIYKDDYCKRHYNIINKTKLE